MAAADTSRFVEIMKACAAGNNTIGNMLCWDRSDLPVSPALTQQYLPQVLVPSCDAVGYIDSPGGPTQFTSPQAAPCVNPTGSSLLQYKDEARDGYIDPRAYKRTSRLVAPLAYTQKMQSRGPSMIAGVTSNLGTADGINIDSSTYLGEGSMPLFVPKGVIAGSRRKGMAGEIPVNW
jgi:hypothetical protein